ncbi:hypothetical protein FGG79_02445 [Bacillus sp. BHET2]|uniref:hypothetical protein n=1 Tax=Bacillus sp. BHET2 TaxID=2583818 RepID=UPI00110D98E6|nr:hypothetical protein [Bacillus sp. BHET2]TMU87020.1 hypothetical protein FGG79_02445 [Bacillus sp. BHET2]
MNYFLKVNLMSILYALMILVPTELMVNVYRLSRRTGWDIATVNDVSGFLIMADLILGTVLFYLITKNWMGKRKESYWTSILWFPYFILFVYVTATFFPTTYRGDTPNPASGIVLIGMLIVYPFYILVMNFLGLISDEEGGEYSHGDK